jgi:hypothetical protein
MVLAHSLLVEVTLSVLSCEEAPAYLPLKGMLMSLICFSLRLIKAVYAWGNTLFLAKWYTSFGPLGWFCVSGGITLVSSQSLSSRDKY